MEVDQSAVGAPGGEDPTNPVVVQGAGQAEPAKEVVARPNVVAGEDVQSAPGPAAGRIPRSSVPRRGLARGGPRRPRRTRTPALRDPGVPRRSAADNSIRARAFWRLNPKARKSSGFSPASSSGRGKAWTGASPPPMASPEASASRPSRRTPRVSVTCWQAIALTTHSKTVGNRGGFMPAEPPRQRPEAVVAGREPLELRQIDAEAEQPLQGRRHGGPRTGAGPARLPPRSGVGALRAGPD